MKKKMGKRMILWFICIFLLALVSTSLLFQPVIRPWYNRWGASDAEVSASLPGDELVTGNAAHSTRAIDIAAPASAAWPWLLQIGQGRGGMYSYDWLENLAGCDIHTLNAIVPELQNLKVGDTIRLGPQEGLPYYTVVRIEPEKALVLRSVDPAMQEPGETWGFYLAEKAGGSTRLVIRHRSPISADSTSRIVNAVFEPISFVMEHKMLYGIRDRAEMLYRQSEAVSLSQ